MGHKHMFLVAFLLCLSAVMSKRRKDYRPQFRWPRAMDAGRLAKQVMMQQVLLEETTRSRSGSGIVHMRQRGQGTRPYHSSSHSDDFTMAATHDHADFVHTCGMGEVVTVMNGVTHKTRHNDYVFVRRADAGANSCETPDYDDTIDIPYPDVPPSVLSQPTLEKQIEEMKKYFDAFHQQHDHHYDYKPYFKANLCYMTGAWTKTEPDDIQEAFFSERHFYEADSWDELFARQLYEFQSGTKENAENYAFMPTRLWEVKDDGELVFAQWNYKILCHPIDGNVPLNRLRAVDDLKTRMSLGLTYEEALTRRSARFQVNPHDSDLWIDGAHKFGLLDEWMSQIPGPDGYGAKLTDDAFGELVMPFNQPEADATPLNTNYFHRWFKNRKFGAMGSKVRMRGMADDHCWVAMTTSDRVLPSRLESCDDNDICESWEQKWVYALPMEIIYTTPLSTWNPHNIEYKGNTGEPYADTIFDGPSGERNGADDPDKAFDGINSVKFYMTPFEFFHDPTEFEIDPADTPSAFVHVLDDNGAPQKVRSSGIRTFLPSIHGVGRVRQRYPIHPVAGEGDPVWMELAALRDVVKNLEECLAGTCSPAVDPVLQLITGPSNVLTFHPEHQHLITITPADLAHLDAGHTVTVVTEQAEGHTHSMIIQRSGHHADSYVYSYVTCGGLPLCHDGHPTGLTVSTHG